jgi:hypothetical protein
MEVIRSRNCPCDKRNVPFSCINGKEILMNPRWVSFLLFALLMIVTDPQIGTARESETVSAIKYGVVTEVLNARAGPGLKHAVLPKQLQPGMMLRYVEVGNGWARHVPDSDLPSRIEGPLGENPIPALAQTYYFNLGYVREVNPQEFSPIPLLEGEKRSIVIDLSEQKLTAYSNGTVFLETPVSTGKEGFETPTGNFSVYYKRFSQTMVGWNAAEGFWIVENIPAVQYVVGNVAIHGTWWHNNFGTPMSHGCINVPLEVAELLYAFTTPYHAPFNPEDISGDGITGTEVIIQP